MTAILDQIELVVCSRFNLTPAEFHGHDRQRRIARPRQIAMFLAREMTPLSFPKIGRHMNRDHTTILLGDRRIRELMALKPYFAEQVQGCREIVSKMIHDEQSTHKTAA